MGCILLPASPVAPTRNLRPRLAERLVRRSALSSCRRLHNIRPLTHRDLTLTCRRLDPRLERSEHIPGAHAPIDSALSPNRYLIGPSNTRTCSTIPPATACDWHWPQIVMPQTHPSMHQNRLTGEFRESSLSRPPPPGAHPHDEIGRASCRERV